MVDDFCTAIIFYKFTIYGGPQAGTQCTGGAPSGYTGHWGQRAPQPSAGARRKGAERPELLVPNNNTNYIVTIHTAVNTDFNLTKNTTVS